MSECLIIALVGALINMILSLLVPCIIKESQAPILVNIKKVYATHKQTIITSSVIVFITIYLALKITPMLGLNMDNDMSSMDQFDGDMFRIRVPGNSQLGNLAGLENLFRSSGR